MLSCIKKNSHIKIYECEKRDPDMFISKRREITSAESAPFFSICHPISHLKRH